MDNLGQLFVAVIVAQVAIYLLAARSPARRLADWSAIAIPVAGLALLLLATRPGQLTAVPSLPPQAAPAPVAAPPQRRELSVQGPVQIGLAPADRERVEAEVARVWSERLAAAESRHQRAVEELRVEIGRLKAQHESLRTERDQARGSAQADLAAEREGHERTKAQLLREIAERERLAADRQRADAAGRELAEKLAKSEALLSAEVREHARTKAGQLAAAATASPIPQAPPALAPAAGYQSQQVPTAALKSGERVEPPPPQPPEARQKSREPLPASVAASGQLRAALDAGISSPVLELRPLPTKELVAGRAGSYYAVTLLSPATGKRFVFESERYVLADKDADLRDVFALFKSEVMDNLPEELPRTLYLRAYASDKPPARNFQIAPTKTSLNRVSYLPLAGAGGQFRSTAAEQVLSGSFQHAHLPVLRAAVAREIVIKSFPGMSISLLGGELKPSADPAANSLDLILYVPWPEPSLARSP